MQEEFQFPLDNNTVYSEAKLNILSGIDILVTDLRNYFGSGINKRSDIKLPVTGLVLACKCPRLFGHCLDGNNEYNFQLAKIPIFFSIGTKFDKYAKEFLKLPVSARSDGYIILRAKLAKDLERFFQSEELIEFPISKNRMENRIERYLYSFDSFCEFYKGSRLSLNQEAFKKLEFKVGKITLRGQIDLLLESKTQGKFVLIDLKLQKFGKNLEEFGFSDLIQVLLYAYALEELNIPLDSLGYYYFLENTLVFEKMENLGLQKIKTILINTVNQIIITREFIPRKCELCLICPIKSDCKIGKNLKATDFDIPLMG